MQSKQKLLLHSCCGPCSTVCIERLKEEYDITVYYYNPCIYPKQEFDKRLAEQKRFLKANNIPIIEGEYDNASYLKLVEGHELDLEGQARCEICFMMRLDNTARLAKKNNFDCFTTTLTVSPHKNTEVINRVGKTVGEKYSILFLEKNFKKQNGYQESIQISKNYELYRQNYCGCQYSKGE